MKIGWLNYKYNGKRAGNVGQDIFLGSLRSYKAEECHAINAMDYDVLLVSIPSTFQMIDYLKIATRYRFDLRHKTKIIVGGYGAINPRLIDPYFDHFWLGRVHDIADDVINIALDGGMHESCVTPGSNSPKIIRQAPMCEVETFVGCKYRCKFCQYSHIRSRQGASDEYVQNMLMSSKSPEIMFKNIFDLEEKPGRLRTAIDGYSERLRLKYSKKITNEMLSSGIRHLAKLTEGKKPIVAMLYNISNMPGESEDDRLELENVIKNSVPDAGRVIIIIHSTPFRPSPLTPLQYDSSGVWPSQLHLRGVTIADGPTLLSKHSAKLEGPYSTMQCVVAERAGMQNAEEVREALTRPRHKTTRSEDKAKELMYKFPEVERLIGKQTSLPTDFITLPPSKYMRANPPI